MRSQSLYAVVLALAPVAGCSSERGTPTPEARAPAASAPNVVTFTAADYRFEGPAEIPAGLTQFRLTNKGTEPHHLTLVRLDQGRTFDSLMARLRRPGPPPAWARPVGGPNAPDPGAESNAEHMLEPGNYAVLCFVPTKEGVPHLAKGMVAPLKVTAAAGPAATPRDADVVMKLVDYDFELSSPLTPGERIIRVENSAQQMHEVELAKLSPGKSVQDLIAWEMGGRKGEAPGKWVGGIATLAQGEQGQFTVEVEPGNYALICFVPDAKDGKPHLAHGMAKTIKVG